MVKNYTAPEIEKKVYDHIIKKTSKGYTFNFNPLDVSEEGIADELNLEDEEVEEAIESLSGQDDGKTSRLKRIKSVKPRFVIWLPNTKGGQDIKNALCESGMAITGKVNILYSFLIILLGYFLIFEKPYLKNLLEIKTPINYFLWAVIITTISIPIGTFLAHRWFQATLMIQKVKGYKYYIYGLIIITVLVLFSIKQNWENIWSVVFVIAAICNIGIFIFQLINENRKK